MQPSFVAVDRETTQRACVFFGDRSPATAIAPTATPNRGAHGLEYRFALVAMSCGSVAGVLLAAHGGAG